MSRKNTANPGVLLGGVNAFAESSEISTGIAELQINIEKLHSNIIELQNRLDTVLFPVPPDNQESPNCTSKGTPLGLKIEHLHEGINIANNRIICLISNLGI